MKWNTTAPPPTDRPFLCTDGERITIAKWISEKRTEKQYVRTRRDGTEIWKHCEVDEGWLDQMSASWSGDLVYPILAWMELPDPKLPKANNDPQEIITVPFDPWLEEQFLDKFQVSQADYQMIGRQLIGYLYKIPVREAEARQVKYAQERIWNWAVRGYETGLSDVAQTEPVKITTSSFAYRWATNVGREAGRRKRLGV